MKPQIFLNLFFIFCSFFATKLNAEKYFGYESISPDIIDKPYKINSQEHINELNQIIKIQKNINDDDLKEIDKAFYEKNLIPETLVFRINKSITREKFPKTYKLLDNVAQTSREVTDGIKDYWKFPRPYLVSSDIQTLITPSKGYCYPSGHATGGFIYAQVLSLLLPKKTTILFDYANEIAWHRVLVGMHYPQDIKAGKQLATFLIGGLLQNKNFQHDLSEAKNELLKNNIIK